ncbi:hypothetical protein M0R45_023573 [Rubus argutus]|uniref:non-specific serine/threonine protein kinase n=1 Tax=Rubus argutus TaxID=59490 RepID=A0AAW1WRQ0_RUBAR
MAMPKPNRLFLRLRAPIFFIFFFSSRCEDDHQYTQCKLPFNCGLLKNVTYPFWGGTNRSQDCGRLGFELINCEEEDQFPRIKIANLDFHVSNISSQELLHTMTIARSDLWDTPCTQNLVNTTLDYNRFSYVQTVRNLTLYYGCVPQNESVLNNFTCKIDGMPKDRNITYYTDDSLSRVTLPGRPTCITKIRVPIVWDGFDVLPKNATEEVEKVLRRGFQVDYSADWDLCRACVNSNGTCVSNSTTDSFLCLCGDRSYNSTCPIHDSSYYDACKPQTCGNGPNISYPSFKLACNDQNPVLTISDDDYIIRDIFYSNHSFLVANSVAFKEDEYCPLPLHNLSLDQTPFSYSSTHVDFSFFYNCSQEPVDYMHTYAISCSSNSTFHSFATFHKEAVEYMNHTLLDSCESSVDVPVDDHEAAGVDTLLEMSYTEILKMGFLLNWIPQNCSNCVTSGGRCGFNDNEFVCFCSDRTHDKTCDDGEKLYWGIKVVVGVCSAFVTIAVMCSIFLLWQRCRNRKRYGQKKALIYEFMPNGSLEKFIYKDSNPLKTTPHLELEGLFQIATGIARGLEYLHRGCNTLILHFDIKPHNILLDENFCPKISDFGLSKLCTRKESIISMLDARGTIGYIAPEVFCRNFGRVSAKSDVYSYGMMILEMVGGRKNVDTQVSHTSEIYFPDWVYEHLEQGSNFGLLNAVTEEEKEIARKMILVGLWCIQTKPSVRPSMSKVIDMLEGSIEALQIPPKPILSSPVRSLPLESTTLSTLN